MLLVLWGAAGAAALARLAETSRARLATVVSLAAPLCAVIAAGVVTGSIAGTNPVARVSLSTGFWATVIIGYASFLSASARAAFPAACSGGSWGSRSP